ncbi:LiaF transmembrane domain-containing protein [Pedobacter sp. NJ-S-72]
MKLNRVMWGVVLLFVGAVLLLENFDIINFYWRNVWSFWPVFLIIAGVNILFNRNKSETGNMISLGVLVVMLGFMFYRGQQPPLNKNWIGERFSKDLDLDLDSVEDGDTQKLSFTEPFITADSAKKTVLNISGGGTSFNLEGETDQLITADVERKYGNFILQKESSDSVNTVTFKMKDKKGNWSLGNGGNDVDLKLNKKPEWTINMNMGAGEVKLDLSDYKMRSFRFDGGAASVDLKVGTLLPITDVVVKTGVASVEMLSLNHLVAELKLKLAFLPKIFLALSKSIIAIMKLRIIKHPQKRFL